MSTLRASRSQERALTGFWSANSLPEALESLRRDDPSGIFAGLALTSAHAAQAHQQNAARGIGAGVNASEFLTRSMRSHIVNTQSRIERGLTFLASVGSTAPFIGLFGTVWGIYHALVGLSGATQVVLDKVAGPVGEALIMTAAGLFVAIPAVLADGGGCVGDVIEADDDRGFLTSAMWHLVWSGEIEMDLNAPWDQGSRLAWATDAVRS